MSKFCHLHCHTQYSLLDGAAKINNLVSKAKSLGMEALAITDHGNMFGVPKFVSAARKEGIKPIIGCEFYVATDMHDHSSKVRYHQVLLAKNEKGYKNLAKLCSLGYIEGYYYKPRIDKKLISQYSEGIIATTCCLASEVCRTIIDKGEHEAEKIFAEWLSIFGEDYYIELQRHGIPEQDICNEILLKWAKKHQVKVIATNDVHYVEQKDSVAQDVLLCLQTGADYDDPKRMRFDKDQFFLKSPTDMLALFADVPDAIYNTEEIISKIETPKLERDILLPIFKLPEGFFSEDDYLKHLAFQGAKYKYRELTQDIVERLEYELQIIKTMGFAGYFLIVQDFINAARKMGVAVGPGRGSAAGSAVAYSVGITNIDPIKYNLLFERFLNPERVSMPDIDIDFDDIGRQKVIDYVVDLYGRNQVAQIITFGTMAAKSAIKDVARVLGLPLPEANTLAKLVPETLGITLAKAFAEVEELAKIKENLLSPQGKVLNFAETLEGSARHTGIHAAGIIIAPNDLLDHIPVCTSKESDLLVTQYDGSIVESVGMLKMDFLGLKTLTIIQTAIKLIEKNHGVTIDIDEIPLEDLKTFELYQRGDTIGTFQFESEGMRMYLRDLKPTNVEDLIAMNALYRPGPMQFIPNFINRKHGRESIEYPHELLEPILKNTYGIMVYQEQIMQTAQILAGYTLGSADILRRAMGKKKKEEMDKQREIFVSGSKEKNNIPKKQAEEIFDIMEKFAAYGFNRSHSAAYSIVAYQTAYLKAHYPSEYMSAVLTHNMNNIEKITFFMNECKKQNLPVLGPDINESNADFDVNKEGKIRFGLGAIKGTGETAVQAIISEREKNGTFKDVFDVAQRVNLRTVNKKTFESLAQGGAFDEFKDIHRAQYFHTEAGEDTHAIEKIIKYGNAFQSEKMNAQQSLFGNLGGNGGSIAPPKVPNCEMWSDIEKLNKEKEVVGFYISGHPLDKYKAEIMGFCTCTMDRIAEYKNREITVAGIVTKVVTKQGKNGNYFTLFTVEDYQGPLDMAFFGQDHIKLAPYAKLNNFLFIKGKVQVRYGSQDQWELKPTSIQLLSEVREKLAKGIGIRVDVKFLNETMIDAIEELLKAHAGSAAFKVNVYDEDEKLNIDLLSRKYRITIKDELFEDLDKIEGITYKVLANS